jgi:hypothetical protein
MLTKRAGEFEAKCDVCGATEKFHAFDHAEAWGLLSRQAPAWAVRKNGFPVIHVCPECPVEVSRERTS